MIPVSDAFKSAYLNGNQKDLTLTFSDNTVLTDDNIVAESMSLEQTICSEQQLTFGGCGAAQFKVKIFNSAKKYEGLTFTATITAHDEEDNDYSMDLGIFKVTKDTVTDDRLYRNIVAYDALYEVMNTNYAAWYSSLTFPMTVKQFRDAFFTHVGITQENISLINDSMTVEKTVRTDTFSGSKIIQAICEINAVFGCINNAGHFRYIPFISEGGLYPANDLYPADDLYPKDGYDVTINNIDYSYNYGSFVYEDYVSRSITGLAIVENADDTSVLYGTADNLYKITNNYLLYGKDAASLQAVANNFLDFVKGFLYNPSKIKMRAMPWVEMGDLVGVVGKTGNAILPILKRNMTGITALYDQYSANGREYFQFSANTVSGLEEKLSSKTMKIEADVDHINTTLTEKIEDTEEELTSMIEQTSSEIVLKVDSSGKIRKAEVGQEAAQGTEVKVGAGNLSITASQTIDLMSGGTINLTSESIQISSTHFSVDTAGNVTATNGSFSGTINATGGTISGALTITGSLTAGTAYISNNTLGIGGETLTGYGGIGVNCSTGFVSPHVYSNSCTGDVSGYQGGHVIVTTDNDARVGTIWASTSTTALWARIGGGACAWSVVIDSDARLKKNIKDTEESGLDTINQIRHIEFDWKKDEYDMFNRGHQKIGYLADQLKEINESFVIESEVKKWGMDNVLSINDKPILYYVTKAIQELSDKVDRLEGKVG